MAAPLLQLTDISLTFGGEPVLSSASVRLHSRDRAALVGRNGSGKTTLMKVAGGLIDADGGERFVPPRVSIGYLSQAPDFGNHKTVGAYMQSATDDESRTTGRQSEIMDALGLTPDAAVATLSGGQARRAALARVLSADHDVVLLDEPTNHLDLPAIYWLETFLNQSRMAALIISHDRAFLEAMTTRTIWIDRGRTRELSKGFAAFEDWRDKLLEEERLAEHKKDRKIAAEEDWVRYGVTARRKRNVRRLYELQALRAQRRAYKAAPGVVKFASTGGEKSSKRVIKADKISKAYGERSIVKDLSIEIGRGERIGIIGPNGVGKTTLLRLLTGEETPDAGEVLLGLNIQRLTLDQNRSDLDEDMRVADAITDGRGDWVTLGETRKHASAYLQDFLFTPEQWRAPVRSLSGGERGRLALAATLAKPSNLLVLDEPTNDLDLETLEVLEERLADYPGTLLLISHDRRFLDRLVTGVIGPSGEVGIWVDHVGGYADFIERYPEAAARWSAQRTISAQKPKLKASPQDHKTSAPSGARKLSYKDQYALRRLPDDIASLEEEIAALETSIADAAFFSRDPAGFAAAAAELEARKAELGKMEDAWLTLEIKREAIEKGDSQ